MSEFSATDAALEGFRVTRERPTALLWWWGAYIVAGLVQFGLGQLPPFHGLAQQMSALQGHYAALQQNPGDRATAALIAAQTLRLLPGIVAYAVLILAMQVIVSTAILRAVLAPADARYGYLRLSRDEVRQVGLAVVVLLAVLVYGFAVSLASGLVLAVLASLAGPAGPSVLAVLAPVVLTIAFLYPAVRLSLAPAMTFADGRISLLRSWPLTQGRFWPLLGTYLVTAMLALVVLVLGSVVTLMAVRIADGGAIHPALAPADLLRPAGAVDFLLGSLVYALLGAIIAAPGASAFRQLAGRIGAPPPQRPRSSASPWSGS